MKSSLHSGTVSQIYVILGDPGADSGGEGKSKRAGKYGTKKSKERREEPPGQDISKDGGFGLIDIYVFKWNSIDLLFAYVT